MLVKSAVCVPTSLIFLFHLLYGNYIRGTQQSRTVLETPEMHVVSLSSDDRSRAQKGYALAIPPTQSRAP